MNRRNLARGKIWLGGMDSNHDSQIQSLMSCQLDDLPAGEALKGRLGSRLHNLFTLFGKAKFVNR